MKLLLVGSDSKYAIELPYLKYMGSDEAVEEINLFTARTRFFNYYNKNGFNKIVYRMGLSTILRQINRELLKEIRKKTPNVVFVFKGMEIFPETLKKIKEQGIKLINYNPDNPFIFSGRGSGNKNISNSISLYDLHFTYDNSVKKRIESEFGIECHLLPFGYEIPDSIFEQSITLEEIKRVCFLGNADKFRAAFIDQLALKGVLVDVYGNGWNTFLKNKNVDIHQAVYGDELWFTLRKYRAQLNLMRLHNPHSHNMRTFEVPAVGGIMLAPNTPDHRLFFEDGKECFLFDDVDQAVQRAKRILSLSDNEAMAVRQAARNRSLNSGYSYRDRAKRVLNEIKKNHD